MRNVQKPGNGAPDDYGARVNRPTDHIARNLAEPMRPKQVSVVAGFSPFHFHRVTKTASGEPINAFVTRQRLEHALYLMSHARRHSLTDVVLECGFSSSSAFSRSFRQRYGSAPSLFDIESFRTGRREEFQRLLSNQERSPRITTLPAGENLDGFETKLRDMPARTVAYIRVIDPFREGAAQSACKRLLAWATERGLADGQWLGYMWDEPEIVAPAHCRYDVAVVVDDLQADGEIGRFEFPPMRVAEVALIGDLALEARAIDWLYNTWLPQSGYIPDNQPVFEAWVGRPFAHGNEHFELACQLPVKRG